MTAMRDSNWVQRKFGRFAWKESEKRRGAIEILGEWERQNIVAMPPVLALRDGRGRPVSQIRCHRLIARPLRETLEELAEEGLGHLINTFDGCFVPRHMGWDPKQPLSRHAWGIAVDINARLFPYGSAAKQDRRLVAAFARHGFSWGGDWRKPDPMHFEIAELPDPRREIRILVGNEHVGNGYLEEGRVMAPVRAVAQALGCLVEARMEEGEVMIHPPLGGEWR